MRDTTGLRWLFRLACFGAAVAWLTVPAPAEVTGTAVDALGEKPPAAPKGYASQADVLKAIQAGEVKLINPFPSLPDEVEATGNIEYGRGGDAPLLLDLYRPKGFTGKAPGLIFIHGGGWKSGKRNDYRPYCIEFARKGYVVATVTYRLSSQAKFPAAVHDVKAAVRWMRAVGPEYGVDPDHIAVIGGSAGGHLSMMAGYVTEDAELEGTGGHPEVSSRVQAVVNLYGPTDLTRPAGRVAPVVLDFLGVKNYEEAPDKFVRLSPINYVTPDDPPTLILHGTVDEIVPIDQADLLASKLKQLKIPYIYDRIDGWPHTMDLSADVNARAVWLMERFLGHYLVKP